MEQEKHPGTEQAKEPKGPKRSRLDLSLKEAILSDNFRSEDKEFHILGAMLLIDLQSERCRKKLLLAPLVI